MNRVLYLIISLCIVTSSFAALNNKQISKFENEIKLFQTDDNGIPTFVSGDLRDKVVKGAELNAVHDYFELNNTDPAVISADSVSIYLVSGEYIHRLQSVTIDVAFEREDQKGLL